MSSTFNSAAATVIKITFIGNTENGPISIPGLLPGDAIMQMIPGPFYSGFEPVVTVADELQQMSNLDWSTVTFTVYLLRGV